MTLTDDDYVAILGGGATCFSMGTYWNRGPYSFRVDEDQISVDSLNYVQTVETVPGVADGDAAGVDSQTASGPKVTSIPRVSLDSSEEFKKILERAQPVVLCGLDLGSCVANWGFDYIVDKVGAERKVRRIPTPADACHLLIPYTLSRS